MDYLPTTSLTLFKLLGTAFQLSLSAVDRNKGKIAEREGEGGIKATEK